MKTVNIHYNSFSKDFTTILNLFHSNKQCHFEAQYNFRDLSLFLYLQTEIRRRNLNIMFNSSFFLNKKNKANIRNIYLIHNTSLVDNLSQ